MRLKHLIISGPTEDRSHLYTNIDNLIPNLDEKHFELEEKTRTVNLTDSGIEYLETVLRDNKLMENNQSLYDPESTSLVHHINQALLAHKMFNKNKDYIVRNNEIVLIDEFTGRMMSGRDFLMACPQLGKRKMYLSNQKWTLHL